MNLVPILLAGLAVSGFGGSTVTAGLVRPPPESVRSQAVAPAVSDSKNNAAGVARGLGLPIDNEYDLMIRPKRVLPPTRVEIPEITEYSMMQDPSSMDTGDLESDRKKSVFGVRLNGPTRYESLSDVEPIRHNSPILTDEQYEEASRRQWMQNSGTYPVLRSRKGMLERREESPAQLESRHRGDYNWRGLDKTANGQNEQTDQSYLRHFLLSKLLEQMQGAKIEKQVPLKPEMNDFDVVTPKEIEDDAPVDPVVADEATSQPMANTYRRYKQLRQSPEDVQLEQDHRLRQWEDPNDISNPYYAQQSDKIRSREPDQPAENTYRKKSESSHAQIGQAGEPNDETFRSIYMISKLLQKLAGHTSNEQEEAEPQKDLDQAASGDSEPSQAQDKADQDKPVKADKGDSQVQADEGDSQVQADGGDSQVQADEADSQVQTRSHLPRRRQNPKDPNIRQHPYYPNQPDIIPTGDPDYPMENIYRNLKEQRLSRRQHVPNPYYPNQPDIIPTGDPDYPMENIYRNLPIGGPNQPMDQTYRGDHSSNSLLRLGHAKRPNRFKKSKPETEDIHEASEQHLSRRQASSTEEQDELHPWEVKDLLTAKHYPIESNGEWQAEMRKRRHRPAKVKVQKQNLKEVDESETTPEESEASLRNGDEKLRQQESDSENFLRIGRPRRPHRPAKNPKPQNYDVDVDLQWSQSEGAVQEPAADADQSPDARRGLRKQQPNEPEDEDEEQSNSLMRIGRPKRPHRPKKAKAPVDDLEVEAPEENDQHGSQPSEADDPEVLLRMREAVQKPSDSNSSNEHCSAESSDSASKQRLDDEDELASPESQDEGMRSSARSGVASSKGTAEKEGVPSTSLPLITPENCPCRRRLRAQPWFHVGEDRVPI